MANNTIIFTLIGKDQASKAFNDASKSADQLAKKTDGIGKLGTAAKAAAVGGVLALGAALVSGVRAAANYEVMTKKTEAVIKSTGNVANISVGGVTKLAASLENMSGVDEELIINSQNVLATFTKVRNEAGKGNDVFNQGTKAALDMSVALGTDLQSATMLVGKALNDPIRGMTALRRSGVQLTEQQQAQIKTMVEAGDTMGAQKVILGELSTQFGGAAKAAGDTFAGKLARAQDALGDMARDVGSLLLPVLGLLADSVGAVVTFFGSLPTPVKIAATAITILSIATLVLSKRWGSIKGAAAGAIESIKGMSTAARIANASLGAIGLVLTIGATLLGNHEAAAAKAKERQDELAAAGKRVADAIREQNGVLNESVVKAAAQEAENEGLLTGLEKLGFSYKDVTDAILGQGDAYDRIRDKLKAAIARSDVVVDGGMIDQQTVKLFQLLHALDGVVGGKNKSIEADGRVKAATDAAIGSIDKQVGSLKELLEIQETLAGKTLDYREAQRRYEEAIDAVRESIKENGKEHDKSDAKGRANQVTLDALAAAAHKQAEAMRANGGSQDLVRKKMGEARKEFIKAATQMGMSETAAKKLANKLRLIPGEYEADITADTTKGHQKVNTFMSKDIARVTKRFKSIIDADTTPGRNKITKFIREQQDRGIVLSTEGKFLGFTGGGYRPPMKAAGGPIYGPGTSTSDSIPAWLSDGEFVVKASSYRKHRALVEAINADKVPGFAKGGAAVKLPVDVNMSGWLSGVNAMIKKFAESMGGPGIAGALNWARSQVGKPYVWGGVGPGGYDCSGFMSAIANKIRGRNPYSRLGSTATFPWSGFSPGVGPFMIGSSRNTGFGIGHMAGTLGGVNVESRGGDGVVVGGSARGARSGMFGGPFALRLAMGGIVGDPPWDQLDPRGKYYGKLLGSFAAGTRYVPKTGAYELHRGEAVTPATQNVPPTDAREWAREFAKELKRQGITVIPAGRQADLIMRSG
jgi:tetratricopeptide (TPR) repeat protein